jgi:hypothetical protein
MGAPPLGEPGSHRLPLPEILLDQPVNQLGDAALDFSRRLCSINLVYGSDVLVSARTFALAKEQFEARPMEMVYAPRMHQISEVYELLAPKGTLNDEEI